MTLTKEVKKLSVSQYEFYKQKGMSDEKVMKLHGYNTVSLNAWKKENDLIGKKYGVQGKKPGTIKQVSIDKEEPKLLKENKVDPVKVAPKTNGYEANQKLQEKLAQVKESFAEYKQKEEPKVLPLVAEQAVEKKPAQDSTSQIEVAKSELFQEIAALKEENERLRKASAANLLVEVNDAVKAERRRQNELYGHQRHSYGDWLMILAEEQGEVAQAMQKEKGWGKETDASNLYEELIHVAAVASAIAEQVLEERSSNGS